ncbi:MAG: DUF4124 domain-containing protein [Pseudomonadota bacterium]|nr:DUF4124 domain-containing protein [Pseudomonadota bacterium]
MNKPLVVAVATSVAMLAASLHAAERTIRRWVDANGVVHYGDAPPPDAAKTGSTVLNRQGVPVREIPRQMTPEEAAAARQQLEEESRRKAQDSFLLTTYTKVSDIERARDDQLALIDSHIELAKGSVASVEQRLGSLRQRMGNFKPYSRSPNARRVPDVLANEAVYALAERRSTQEVLEGHQKRRDEMSAKYDGYITRYLELINRPSIR